MVPLLTIGGRIAKGFDFLGYSFEPKGLSIAPKTLANFLERKTQLYEQGADVRRIGQYVRNWWRWVRAGVELGVNKLNVYSFFCLPSGRYLHFYKKSSYNFEVLQPFVLDVLKNKLDLSVLFKIFRSLSPHKKHR